MGTWLNSDGLYIKYGPEEAEVNIGGEYRTASVGLHEVEFSLGYTEFDSATPSIPHTADGLGIIIPKGAKIKNIEFITTTAFTSSGTVGSSTLSVGFKKASDRSTELDHDALTTSSATATVLKLTTVGASVVVDGAATGAGAYLTSQTTMSENGIVVLCNTAHASHPHTAGAVKIIIRYFFP